MWFATPHDERNGEEVGRPGFSPGSGPGLGVLRLLEFGHGELARHEWGRGDDTGDRHRGPGPLVRMRHRPTRRRG